MKKLQKVLGSALAVAMLISLSMALTAHAAVEGAIVVKGPPSLGLDAGDFKAYKLFDVSASKTDGIEKYAYTPVAAVDNFLDTYTAYAPDLRAYLEDGLYIEDDPNLTEFTRTLKASGLFEEISATPDGDNVKFTELEYGYYLVTGLGKAPGQDGTVDVVAHSALVTVSALNEDSTVTINLKADAPEIKKEVWDDNTEDWGKWTDANIGDTVEFQLTTAVPDMKGYAAYKFIVYDVMSYGMTYTPGTVDVKLGEGTLTLDEDYTVSISELEFDPDDSHTWFGRTKITIEFIDFIQYMDDAGTTITITYSGIINEQSMQYKGDRNLVYLEYSNDPYSDGTGETPDDTVYVYSYTFNIYKFTGDINARPRTDKPLAGAIFELHTADGDAPGDAINLISMGVSAGASRYRPVMPDEAGATKQMTTDPDNGMITLIGLDAGAYYLVEVKAPDGYNILGAPVKILIEQTGFLFSEKVGDWADYEVTSPDTHVTVEDYIKQRFYEVDIQNNTGVVFPETGGIGRTIFIASGLTLMLGAAVAGIISYGRKKTVKSAE